MNFLAELMDKQRPEECNFTEADWLHLVKASRVGLDNTKAALEHMKTAAKKVGD